MKATLKINGKDYDVELTEDQVKKIEIDDVYIKKDDDYYFISTNGDIGSANRCLSEVTELKDNLLVSKRKSTLERAIMRIQLENFADKYNNWEHDEEWYFIHKNGYISASFYGEISKIKSGYVIFSSKEIAQKALDYFGKEFFTKLYSQY